MLNRLDPDQARHFDGPDLGPDCLQKLSADDTKRCKVKLLKKKESWPVPCPHYPEVSFAVFNSLPPQKFFMLFCRLLIFFLNQFFRKILSHYQSVKQFKFRSGLTFCQA